MRNGRIMSIAHWYCILPQFCYGASKVQTQVILPALTCLFIRKCRNFFFFFSSFFFLLLFLLPSALQPTVGFGLSNNVLPFFFYLPPTLSIFSLPAFEDLILLPLSIFSWVFPFFSSLPVLEWRSFWTSYLPPFSLGDLTSLDFTLLSILLYFLLCSSLLVLDSSVFSIAHFHI